MPERTVAKNKTKQQRKILAKKRTMRAHNTEANLASGILHPESKNEFSVAHFLK